MASPTTGAFRQPRFPLLAQLLRSPGSAAAAVVAIGLIAAAFLVPPLMAQDPFAPGGAAIWEAFTPPVWMDGGSSTYLLGTDNQGRDMVASMLFGLRTSLVVGFLAVGIGLVLGVTLGLVAGFVGGVVDAVIMRLADIQLAYPALLLAMIISGAAGTVTGPQRSVSAAITIVVVSIGVSFWVQYARTVRSSVLVERDQDYVAAARITGRSSVAIMFTHILPNVMGPVLVIATINLAIAIITEATLSFLGIGIPLTQPSLGTIIRNGNSYLQSGEWWIVVWPCLLLIVFVIAINVLGDWMRDALNPRLKRRG
nr:ABC transporter permease [Mesorhizobium loti]